MLERLTAADARRWAVVARAAFAARRAEIDALNVFPVPDGDTGTNLYLTFDAALDAVRTVHEQRGILGHATLEEECTSLGQAMLLTARGNSGVILSQIVRGFAEAIAESGAETADGALVAEALAICHWSYGLGFWAGIGRILRGKPFDTRPRGGRR